MHLNLRPLLIQRHQPALSITPPPDMRPARRTARPAPHADRRVPALCLSLPLCISMLLLLWWWCIPIVLLSRLVRPRRRQLDHPAGRLQLGCAGDKRAVHVSIGILAAVGGELAGVALVAPVVVGVAATLLLLGVAVGGATADAGRLHGLLLLVVDVVEVGWVGGVWAGVAGAGVGEVEHVVVCRGGRGVGAATTAGLWGGGGAARVGGGVGRDHEGVDARVVDVRVEMAAVLLHLGLGLGLGFLAAGGASPGLHHVFNALEAPDDEEGRNNHGHEKDDHTSDDAANCSTA